MFSWSLFLLCPTAILYFCAERKRGVFFLTPGKWHSMSAAHPARQGRTYSVFPGLPAPFPWTSENRAFPSILYQDSNPSRSLNWQHKAPPLGTGLLPRRILFLSTRLKTPREKKTDTYPCTHRRCPARFIWTPITEKRPGDRGMFEMTQKLLQSWCSECAAQALLSLLEFLS